MTQARDRLIQMVLLLAGKHRRNPTHSRHWQAGVAMTQS